MKLPFVKDKPWPEEHPYTWYQAYPRYLYHHKLAPEGKIFKSPEETVGLKRKGWVDNPSKFPKPSRLSRRKLWELFKAIGFVVGVIGSIVGTIAGIVALLRR